MTLQIHTVLWDELSDGSDRSRVIAKELFNPPFSSAVSLDDAVIDFWMQATRYRRVDFAEVCCTFCQSTVWITDVAWWTCRAVQSPEWSRSHHEGRHIKN